MPSSTPLSSGDQSLQPQLQCPAPRPIFRRPVTGNQQLQCPAPPPIFWRPVTATSTPVPSSTPHLHPGTSNLSPTLLPVPSSTPHLHPGTSNLSPTLLPVPSSTSHLHPGTSNLSPTLLPVPSSTPHPHLPEVLEAEARKNPIPKNTRKDGEYCIAGNFHGYQFSFFLCVWFSKINVQESVALHWS